MENFFWSLAKQLPMLEKLKSIPQDPEYHGEGDVFTHTSLVCNELIQTEEWNKIADKERNTLLFAAALHDIGKLTCTKRLDGRITSPNHAVKGSQQFRRLWLRYYGSGIFPEDLTQRDEIAWLIRWHGLPQLFLEKENTEVALRRAAKTVSLRHLALLSEADFKGRKSSERSKHLETIQYFREYAKELGCYETSSEFPNCYTELKYLRGELAWYGDCLYEPESFLVILMMGLPLSGKDTYIKQHFSDMPIISLDDIRQEFSISPTQDNGKVITEGLNRAKEFLRKKESFVWNATNITFDIRTRIEGLCEKYGARVILIYLEAPYEELLKRNEIRERKVPAVVIENMMHKMDMPEPIECYQVLKMGGIAF